MSESYIDVRGSVEGNAENSASPELVELDRVLAALEAEDALRRIATQTPSVPASEALGIPPVSVSDSQRTAVASLASTPCRSLSLDNNAGVVPQRPDARRGKSVQAAVEAVLPSFRKPWRKLWAHERLARSFEAAGAAGGVAFTLNLSTPIQENLIRQGDPVRLMSHYINRELKQGVGQQLPYGFVFEFSDLGRLHLHGVIVPTCLEEEHIRTIDDALAKAGGRLKAERIVQYRQSYLDELYDGLGWFGYLQKSSQTTMSLLGTDKISYVSNSLKRLCSQL